MISGRQSKRLFAALMASTLIAVDVHAAVTDIYNQPLATTSTIAAKPNIMFILDNSGSMRDAYMPDEMSDTGKYGYWSAQCNGVAYDPSYNYEPPVKADGTLYPDANFSAAASDGFAHLGTGTVFTSGTSRAIGVGSTTFTVNGTWWATPSFAVNEIVAIGYQSDGSIRMTGTVTAWDSGTSVLTLNVTEAAGSGTYDAWNVSKMGSLSGSTYYTYSGSQTALNWTYTNSGVITSTTFYQECRSNIGSSPGNGVFTLQTLTDASSATAKQNYANWKAYYGTRRLLMRTAAGRAFQTLNNNFRVGFTTISDTGATNGTNKFLDVADFATAQKADFYKNLYTAEGTGYTPLRASLAKVGRYFANKAPGQTSDPMQYSCQRNFALLSTDGYWNTNAESGTYGPFQAASNTNVGQQDAVEPRPLNDGGVATVTTVTTTTTTTQQQVVTSNRAITNYRRYVWTIGSTLGTCGGNNNRYTMPGQRQDRSATVDTTTTTPQTVVTTTTRTVVTNVATGTVISDNTTSNTNTTNGSPTTVTDATSPGTFANTGGALSGCASATGLSNEGLSPGTTVYSTTWDSTCTGGGCNYNATGGGASSGGSSTGTSNTVLSGPTTTVLSGPTSTVTTTTNNTSSGGVSNTLADVAEYYYATDLRATALSNCTGSPGQDGLTRDVCSNGTMLPNPPLDTATHQHMTSYTIGLGVNGTLAYDPNYLTQSSGAYVNLTNGTVNWPDPIANSGAARIDDLWHAAVNGRGRYFATKNATTLSNALASALSDATKSTGSAAGAATNSLEPVVGDDNKAYVATYTTVEWTGDIRAYTLDATTANVDTSTYAWSAKTQLEALSAGSRNIKYMHPTTKALRAFSFTNLNTDGYGANFTGICSKVPTPLQCGTLSSAQVTLANDGTNLVNFLRGDGSYEAETNLSDPLYRERAAKLGDIINASPVYVKKSPLKYTDIGYTSFVTATSTRRAMVYAAANDGMLHAFDAATGTELWAFVPSFVMSDLYRLADTDYRNQHRYFVDGAPVVADIYTGSVWKTILVGGLNAGGKGYYAIDITDPDNPAGLWEFTDTNMGLTYGNPVVTKRADGTWVVAVSSGLNNADGVGHLYLVNAATGALVTSLSTGTGTAADPSGLNKINAWVDSGVNNIAKRFYGGDMLGNLWRFDFDDLVPPAGAEATKLANFTVGGTPQPITTRPQLTEVTASGGAKIPVIVVATGRYLGTSDVSDTAVQSIYAIKDPLTDSGWGDVRPRSDIVTQTVTISGASGTGTANTVDWNTQIGWKMDLPQSKERVVTDFLVNFNVLTLASAIPGASECNPSGGASWIYEISVGSGRAANGSTISSYLGAFLVVGMSPIMAADGSLRQIIVGSDASVRSRKPTSQGFEANSVRRSAWRELIN